MSETTIPETTMPETTKTETDTPETDPVEPKTPETNLAEAVPGYESIFILHPETGEEDQEGLIEKYKALIGTNGGQVIHHTTW